MKPNIIEVIPATRVQRGKTQFFSYTLPADSLLPKIGSIVEVPFGKKQVAGVVTKLWKGPAFALKPIISILEARSVFTPQLLNLAERLSEYYFASLGLLVKAMLPKISPRAKLRAQTIHDSNAYPGNFILNPEQLLAVNAILANPGKPQTFLLNGVTGSGKTEVYLRVLEKIAKSGKQALILVPEIALTPLTHDRFASRFPPHTVSSVHSRISYGQKYAVWKGVLAGEIKILIGPRSAVFAPFSNLGLIVIDEEHDASYKQSDQNPKFDARTACEMLSAIWSCPLVLGDATPALETFHRAKLDKVKMLSLPNRVGLALPKVELVDMQAEARAGNFGALSQTLKSGIAKTLYSGKQTILFINRRGTATSLLCRDCGAPIFCERCDSPLVYHESQRKLICHHCDRKYPLAAKCPKCQSSRLKFFGSGTERIEREIEALFPRARVLRFDRDSVKTKRDLETLYQKFERLDFDILVGTQLLAKGWDFQNVALVGVVNADTTLSFPDFRANERTFQLITQIAGRAGRKTELGKVYFQTYLPHNFAIRAALKHDYDQFYAREIADREAFAYPPFSRLIKCAVKHTKLERALEIAEQLTQTLINARLENVEVIGPAPAFLPRLRGIYRVYVIIKRKSARGIMSIDGKLAEIIKSVPAQWDIDVDPESLL